MNGIRFEVSGVAAEQHAATPTIVVSLQIDNDDARPVHALVLRCQLRIEPQRRRYSPLEHQRQLALFGPIRQWGESLRPFSWAHVAVVVPSFRSRTVVDVPVPCTYDLDVAGAAYLHGLEGGAIPVVACFAGTLFRVDSSGFEVTPIAWDTDTSFLLPHAVWVDAMDAVFPNSAWLRLSKTSFDALVHYRARNGFPSWDDTFAALVPALAER